MTAKFVGSKPCNVHVVNAINKKHDFNFFNKIHVELGLNFQLKQPTKQSHDGFICNLTSKRWVKDLSGVLLINYGWHNVVCARYFRRFKYN